MKPLIRKFIVVAILICFTPATFAFEDPTKGQPFFPWLWEDQFKPTIQQSAQPRNLSILGVGVLASIFAHQYDSDAYDYNRKGENLLMPADMTQFFALLGGGAVGVGIAGTQIFMDQENGLMHARAIALTAASHVTLAFFIRRKRPGGRGDYLPFPSSFPSGHSSSAFATATALAYSYGYLAGVPAYLVATAISAARVSENAHWLSDVVSGAALGIFWGRASYLALAGQTDTVQWMPVPLQDGAMIQLSMDY